MKKLVMFAGMLFFAGGVSFAAPSPELLESLTTQILEQQTKTKSAKEVLDQLKPIFSHCATSHKDKAVQAVCKSFLEKQFVSLEKKWQEIQIGGLSVFRVGNLKNKERLAYFGLDNIANYSLEKHRLPLNQLDYLVVNMPEFSLSFFVPALSEETALSKDYGLTFKCENLKKHRKESINKMKKDFPNSVGQVLDEEDGLNNTICNSGLTIQRSPRKSKEVFISSAVDTIGNGFKMSISPKQLPKGKTLESIVKEECPTWKASASNIYFDKKGSAYYVLDRRQAQIDPSENFTGLSLAFTGDTSKLLKKPLGVGKNLQKMIDTGEVKMLICNAMAYLQTKDNPQSYYKISFGIPSFLLGHYIGFDLNNPDGTSSFLSK